MRIENRRLKEFAKIKCGGLTKLALALGLSESYFSQYTTHDKLVGIELLMRLQKEYNLSIDWLLTGRGNMLVDSKDNVEIVDSTMQPVPVLTLEMITQMQKDLESIKEKVGV